MPTVRLHRRRIELSWDRWREIRRRHPRKPQTGVTANGIRTVAVCLPITEYALTTDRLHSGGNAESRFLEEQIRSRLALAVQRTEERATHTQELGVLDTTSILHVPDGVLEYYEEQPWWNGQARGR